MTVMMMIMMRMLMQKSCVNSGIKRDGGGDQGHGKATAGG